MLLMEPIVGNSVINMVVHVRSIVAQLDIAAQVQDIMSMAIVQLKWKRLSEIQFMLIVKIIFALLVSQKKRAPSGMFRKKQTVLSTILIHIL